LTRITFVFIGHLSFQLKLIWWPR